MKRAFEEMMRLLVQAMKDLDLGALTKLKMALVSPNRIIGVNVGTGHQGETDPAGDWRELRKSARARMTSPSPCSSSRCTCCWVQTSHDEATYDFEDCSVEEATSVIFASEPLTEGTDDWSTLEFGEIVFLEKDGEGITRTSSRLKV